MFLDFAKANALCELNRKIPNSRKFMITEYRPTHKMSTLINDNNLLIMVMSRFGISLGFGDKTVQTICSEQGVDCATFLSVANFVSNKVCAVENISLPSIINYLKQAHNYFLDFNLPAIRRKLIEAIDCSGSDSVAMLIIKFYDEYVGEVRAHMEHENKTVFTYVDNLLRGVISANYSISVFAEKHNDIEYKLQELKDIIIRYYPQRENNLLNSALFDIINCEQDLMLHRMVEDKLFVPAVARLEEKIERGDLVFSKAEDEELTDAEKIQTLSEREKEIIVCVAKGMSNKEIAEELYLSVHTVTTHRRNISAKLQIHSPAGLTIFAIVNKLIKC